VPVPEVSRSDLAALSSARGGDGRFSSADGTGERIVIEEGGVTFEVVAPAGTDPELFGQGLTHKVAPLMARVVRR